MGGGCGGRLEKWGQTRKGGQVVVARRAVVVFHGEEEGTKEGLEAGGGGQCVSWRTKGKAGGWGWGWRED